jgi:hypothetical protein
VNLILKLATPALRFADKPNYWNVPLLVYTIFVWLVDMLLAHTVWAYFFGFPHKGEWTISHTLERLVKTDLWCALFACEINAIAPGHIKVVV